MAVELAVVLPVMLAVMVIAVDCMVYMGTAARFDHLAPQQVLALASSPSKESYDLDRRMEEVQQALSASFSRTGQSVTVECEDAGSTFSSMVVCRCTLRMVPWPLAPSARSVFGLEVPLYLEHTCSFALDPYTPGEL